MVVGATLAFRAFALGLDIIILSMMFPSSGRPAAQGTDQVVIVEEEIDGASSAVEGPRGRCPIGVVTRGEP